MKEFTNFLCAICGQLHADPSLAAFFVRVRATCMVTRLTQTGHHDAGPQGMHASVAPSDPQEHSLTQFVLPAALLSMAMTANEVLMLPFPGKYRHNSAYLS